MRPKNDEGRQNGTPNKKGRQLAVRKPTSDLTNKSWLGYELFLVDDHDCALVHFILVLCNLVQIEWPQFNWQDNYSRQNSSWMNLTEADKWNIQQYIDTQARF